MGISYGMPISIAKGYIYMIHKFKKTGYIFTDKKNPKWGIMSTILGIISAVSVYMTIYLSYKNGGEALMQYGAVIILVIIYAGVGIILGIRSCMEKDIFRLFPIMGIILNVLDILMAFFILYMGLAWKDF